ncbi:7357_t:CDS:2 [Dentiscutata erythropus]|uniref:7357_t:CDS:1 n=1 Tax=Dentiscutata erythropus TaxID=1348616 RepID=A0A9N9NDW4_9GLOM|nr:7357_t:CDS:2 [Dentiscutata erythropus]
MIGQQQWRDLICKFKLKRIVDCYAHYALELKIPFAMKLITKYYPDYVTYITKEMNDNFNKSVGLEIDSVDKSEDGLFSSNCARTFLGMEDRDFEWYNPYMTYRTFLFFYDKMVRKQENDCKFNYVHNDLDYDDLLAYSTFFITGTQGDVGAVQEYIKELEDLGEQFTIVSHPDLDLSAYEANIARTTVKSKDFIQSYLSKNYNDAASHFIQHNVEIIEYVFKFNPSVVHITYSALGLIQHNTILCGDRIGNMNEITHKQNKNVIDQSILKAAYWFIHDLNGLSLFLDFENYNNYDLDVLIHYGGVNITQYCIEHNIQHNIIPYAFDQFLWKQVQNVIVTKNFKKQFNINKMFDIANSTELENRSKLSLGWYNLKIDILKQEIINVKDNHPYDMEMLNEYLRLKLELENKINSTTSSVYITTISGSDY